MRPRILFPFLYFLFAGLALPADAPVPSTYALSPFVLPGQEAPGTGGTFDQIGSVAINGRGDVAFGARIAGSRFASGIFLLSGGAIRKIALNGEPARYIGPEFSEDFYYVRLAINDLGQVAFASAVGGFPNRQVGVFYFRADDVFPVVVFPPLSPKEPDFVTGVSLNNSWEITFSKSSGVYLFSKDRVQPVVTGEGPTAGARALRSFSNALINNRGQIAFYAQESGGAGGLFLYSDGNLSSIVHEGDAGPGAPGSRFDSFDFRVDDKGEVLFSGDQLVRTSPFGGPVYRRFGLYLYSQGSVSPVAIVGAPLPGQSRVLQNPVGFALSPSGRIAVRDNMYNGSELYLSSSAGFSRVQSFLDGNPPNNAAQLDFYPYCMNDSGALIVSGYALRPGHQIRTGHFLAIPIVPESISPDDFDTPGADGRPLHWSSVWSNRGTGDVSMYDSNRSDAYSGSGTLRLHVGQGGGSIFVLSDPVRIVPDRVYAMTVEMRYALASDADSVAFTVLQYDEDGNEIAVNELDGVSDDNRWTWKQKAIFVHTLPGAESLRIRFGLTSAVEAYADVDALK